MVIRRHSRHHPGAHLRSTATCRRTIDVAYIRQPLSGFYADPVIVLDFQSLYPSLIIAHNLCYSTIAGHLLAVPTPERTNGRLGCVHWPERSHAAPAFAFAMGGGGGGAATGAAAGAAADAPTTPSSETFALSGAEEGAAHGGGGGGAGHSRSSIGASGSSGGADAMDNDDDDDDGAATTASRAAAPRVDGVTKASGDVFIAPNGAAFARRHVREGVLPRMASQPTTPFLWRGDWM